ncbi:DUF1435 domain-containing protein [Kosakonia oryzae]|uniref:DUF1435 domain-containing protein n=1 Tax=Kosakonia oryzae TaxID=497725 RepID=A0AA94KS51_9ENTR|nr:DUF1435 domain-containing protein [Kosakonia oryzae]ANI84611.1 DUF1435 domain-containing protein [Kosakonia oryzae]UDJ85194.1 DUF1435 domain-containing protein [Kosakonia oryzae]SFD07280.1 Protein of unknown function [Kosakonia oryzae]
MILVIIIDIRDKNMLQRVLGSGWGIVLPGIIVVVLALADLSIDAWRMVILLGLLLTPAMLYHKQLRHFVLLPSGVALVGGMIMMLLNLKMMM